jgi:hypothetical protein
MATMGQNFKAAREKKRVSLSQAALKTYIKIQHLEAMERDDFSRMPAPIYARGFIRSYCEFLGIDSAPLLQEYNDRHGGSMRPPVPVDAKLIRAVPGEHPLPTAMGKGGGEHNPADAASDGRDATPGQPAVLNMRTLAIAGSIAGMMLLIVAAAKFWPAVQQENHGGSHVVEVKRPVARSSLAVMREPPVPYVDVIKQGAP